MSPPSSTPPPPPKQAGWAQRRACMQLLAHQQVQVQLASPGQVQPATSPSLLSRAERAHYRLSWAERLARNARMPIESPVKIKLYGVPAGWS
jgi:hypothetical protein